MRKFLTKSTIILATVSVLLCIGVSFAKAQCDPNYQTCDQNSTPAVNESFATNSTVESQTPITANQDSGWGAMWDKLKNGMKWVGGAIVSTVTTVASKVSDALSGLVKGVTQKAPDFDTSNSVENPNDKVKLEGFSKMCGVAYVAYLATTGLFAGENANDTGTTGAIAGSVSTGSITIIAGEGGTTGTGSAAAEAGDAGEGGADSTATGATASLLQGQKYFTYFVCAPVLTYYLGYVPASFLLQLATNLFDYSLSLSMNAGYLNLPFVQDIWVTMRDLSNMFFIFVLIYTGVMTMLGIGGDWRKTLFKVIIFALLINFSLFFTKAVIDVGNSVAVWVYNSMGADPSGLGVTRNLSSSFVKIFEVGNFIPSDQGLSGNFWTGFGIIDSIFLFVLVGILNLVAAWVFFSIAIIFIGRLIAFWILMMAAPAAFVAGTFPKLEKQFSLWLDTLIKQAFLGPVFLFMLYVIMRVMGPIEGMASAQTGQSGLLNMIMLPLLGAIIILVALIEAKKYSTKMAGEFGTFGQKVANMIMGTGGGMAMGSAGSILRTSAGIGADWMFETKKARAILNDKNSTKSQQKWALNRLAIADKLKTNSYDLRNSSAFNSLKGSLKTAGVNLPDFGKGQGKGGYEKFSEDRKKNFDKYSGKLNTPVSKDEEKKMKEENDRNYKNKVDEAEAKLKSADAKLKSATEKTANTEKALSDKEKEVTTRTNKGNVLSSQLVGAAVTGDKDEIDRISKELHENSVTLVKNNTELKLLKESFSSAKQEEKSAGASKQSAQKLVEDVKSEKDRALKGLVDLENSRRRGVVAQFVSTRGEFWSTTPGDRKKLIEGYRKGQTADEKKKKQEKDFLESIAKERAEEIEKEKAKEKEESGDEGK